MPPALTSSLPSVCSHAADGAQVEAGGSQLYLMRERTCVPCVYPLLPFVTLPGMHSTDARVFHSGFVVFPCVKSNMPGPSVVPAAKESPIAASQSFPMPSMDCQLKAT